MTAKPRLISTRMLAGDSSLYSPLGVCIGQVQDILIDPISGRVKYALVSFDFQTLANDLLPLPWEALHHRKGAGGFYTYVTESRLQRGPKFDEDAATTAEWELMLKLFYNGTQQAD